jgi:hypothetical protein
MMFFMKSKKILPRFAAYILGVLILITALFTIFRLRPASKKAGPSVEVKFLAGYRPLISAESYGSPSAMLPPAVAQSVSVEQPNVQNIQPPSISGFSSDLFTGGSTVNYPLDLPPGKGGLTPSLSLNYSSHNVYGPVMGANVNDDAQHNPCDIAQCDNLKKSWSNNLFFQSSQVGLGWEVNGLGNVFRDSTGQFTLILIGQSYRLFKSTEETDWHTNPTGFLKIDHQINFNDEFEDKTKLPDNYKITDTNGTI